MTDQRRLSAIVAADLAGYSRLTARDESGTLAAFRKRRTELVEPAVAAHAGRVVKSMGDGLLLEFPSVVEAVRCAIEIQQGMARVDAGVPAERRLSFRVGVHLGDVVVDGDDILGDGVNVAARLQSIAEPGGIAVSQRVYEEVRDRVAPGFVDGGEQQLKNMTRPIRVWRWTGIAAGASSGNSVPLALPDKPSIAVLAFDNMSGDPEQAHFADGVAEDLITALSHFRELFVIARNSSFVFRGAAVDVKEIGRRLGVRYVVEGSVRRMGKRVRVNAQLIDAATGQHLWAERYDPEVDDIFAVQDELTEAIVAAVAPAVSHLERERARRSAPGSMSAWELYQRGLWSVYRYKAACLADARALFARAIEMDPQFAPAHAGLAYALYTEVIFGFVTDVGANLEQAARHAERAVALDATDAFGHAVLGRVLMTGGNVQAALAECAVALALNPNLASAHYGYAFALALAGRFDEALASLARATRLSPFDPLLHGFLTVRSAVLLMMGRFAEALAAAREAQRQPDHTAWAVMHEAAALVNLGRLDEGRTAMERAYAMQPDISVRWVRSLLPAEPHVDITPYLDGMRRAGLRE